LELPQNLKGSVVTIGNFDGLHIGHQEILKIAKKIAKKNNTFLLAITFEPHPAYVLHPEKAPEILIPAVLKQALLSDYGVDFWLIIKAESSVLSMSPPDFIEKYIVEPISPCALVEGEDFNFGSGRRGNVELLQRLGNVNNFAVTVVSAKQIDLEQTVRVSSTMIRYMIESGEVADASFALGRPYKLIGKIISGRGKGKEIGFPTLNMQKPDQLIPAEGVYAGYVTISDTAEKVCTRSEKLKAVFSIGQARTFGDEHPLLIEAHLLKDIDTDVSGKWMAMEFIEHIRRQHKFTTVRELSTQIAKDCNKAKEILS
jgi:riboflavin kinase/FMN adenylyltransferase